MQRKIPKYFKGESMSTMTLQRNIPDEVPSTMLNPPFCNTLEAALAAFPVFGGTSTETTESPSDAEQEPVTAASTKATQTGGDSAKPEVNVDGMTPEQISELLKQVTDLTTQVTTLTSENNTFKSKEQQATRAKQTREQQLEQDVVDLQQTVAKMDAVIKHTAVINAIQGAKDMEFHSARHVMNELNHDSFDLDVDLENGTATVSGIEAELKRVAKECPWLVSKDKTRAPAGTTPPRQPRGSGSPPAPPGGANDRQTKRSDLINKYPVIAHGRAG